MQTSDNERRLKELLNELSPRAIPKNSAWHRLENMGWQPDYADMDAGEEPKRYE